MPDPASFQSIGWLLVCAAAVIASINQIDAFFKRRTGGADRIEVGGQPLLVRADETYVSQKTFDAHVAEANRHYEQLHARLGGMERGLRDEVKADIEKLHEKVNATNIGVARLESETRAQNTMLAQVRERLDRLISRQ